MVYLVFPGLKIDGEIMFLDILNGRPHFRNSKTIPKSFRQFIIREKDNHEKLKTVTKTPYLLELAVQ